MTWVIDLIKKTGREAGDGQRPDPRAWLFPPTCVVCGAPGAPGLDLCPGCLADLPHNGLACTQCALPFDAPMPVGARCGACQRRAPPFDRAYAAFRYEGAIPYLVTGAKFRGRLDILRLLGLCLSEGIRTLEQPLPEVVVPVPLHPARLRARGYNQALEIARVVGKRLAIPVDHRACLRIHPTVAQAGLEEPARRRNVRGAFHVPGTLRWRDVAILDDVVTTGSTVAELARILRTAGARHIRVWAVARTP